MNENKFSVGTESKRKQVGTYLFLKDSYYYLYMGDCFIKYLIFNASFGYKYLYYITTIRTNNWSWNFKFSILVGNKN